MWRQIEAGVWARPVDVCGKQATAQVEAALLGTFNLRVFWDGGWHVLITGYPSAAMARWSIADGVMEAIVASAQGAHVRRAKSVTPTRSRGQPAFFGAL